MKLLRQLVICPLTGGHRWTLSRSHPGHYTCVRCRLRRSEAWIAKRPEAIFDR